MISFEDFTKVDIRVGRIISVADFPEARKPSYKLSIDFGNDIGIKQSSAQITTFYSKEQLVGKQVLAVINFFPKQIGKFRSEVLTLGVPKDDAVVLVMPEMEVELGVRLF